MAFESCYFSKSRNNLPRAARGMFSMTMIAAAFQSHEKNLPRAVRGSFFHDFEQLQLISVMEERQLAACFSMT